MKERKKAKDIKRERHTHTCAGVLVLLATNADSFFLSDRKEEEEEVEEEDVEQEEEEEEEVDKEEDLSLN